MDTQNHLNIVLREINTWNADTFGWTAADGFRLLLMERVANWTADKRLHGEVLAAIRRMVAADGTTPGDMPGALVPGLLLYTALRETGEERFRLAINHLYTAMQPYTAQMDADTLCQIAPFWMAYEREIDHNAHLADVVALFRQVQPQNIHQRVCRMAALAACVERCEKQLFEHYQALVIALRQEMRHYLRTDRHGSQADELMAGLALLQAIRLGELDWEKYLPQAEPFVRLAETGLNAEAEDIRLLSLAVCAEKGCCDALFA